jgi:uncharacterized protein YecT (DUF1311 family)
MRRTNLLASAALTVLTGLIAVAGPAAAKNTTTTVPAPKPPVIPEPWNPPFPCNQQSNLGIQGCAERKVDSLDARIEAEVKLLFRFLYDNASRRDLVSAQIAWLAYRAADCASQSDEFEGGTQQPVEYILCFAVDDQSRTTDLRSFYADLVQGRKDVPKFP